ncbi:diguanylate cyclase [Corallincola luteus]|uniref:diguanylate cyclase n=1 Tax=Corallincola luteus TaxID=1775177 RepID=A0ABY2ANX5_9GAMM|nr:diguanylate cyclase [Corallincola luteus]TCI03378.1 diguanylate cyclase [Corallincola luteus]
MSIYISFSMAIAVMLSLVLIGNANAEDIDSLILDADAARTKEIDYFKEYLSKIEYVESELTDAQKAEYEYLLAFYFSRTGKTKEAVRIYEKIVRQKHSVRASFKSLISLSNIYSVLGETERAYQYALSFSNQEYSEVESNLRHDATLLFAYNLLRTGLYNEADSFIKGFDLSGVKERSRCLKLTVDTELDFRLERMPADQKWNSEDINYCHNIGEHILAYIATVFVSHNLVKNNKSIEALKILVSDLEGVISTEYDNLLGYWYSTMAEAWLKNGGLEQSIRYAELSLEYDLDKSNYNAQINANRVLFESYEILGDLGEENKHLKAYQKVYESAQHTRVSSAVAFYSAKLKAEESARQIESLNEKLSLADLESQVAKVEAENNRLYLSMALIVVCMLILWVYKTKLHQLRLKKQVEVDALTGVLSRRYFSECFEKALVSAQPAQQSVSFVLFDLDHFKRINDSYGHPAGDWVLKAVGEVCSSSGRRADLVGRLGGEEFGILLPDCDMANATRVAEQCRLAIERIDSAPAGAKFQITASFGVSASSVVGYDSRALIVDADKALYLSKKHGRNRVTLSPNYDNSVILGAGI